jgi:hypothetical protein
VPLFEIVYFYAQKLAYVAIVEKVFNVFLVQFLLSLMKIRHQKNIADTLLLGFASPPPSAKAARASPSCSLCSQHRFPPVM